MASYWQAGSKAYSTALAIFDLLPLRTSQHLIFPSAAPTVQSIHCRKLRRTSPHCTSSTPPSTRAVLCPFKGVGLSYYENTPRKNKNINVYSQHLLEHMLITWDASSSCCFFPNKVSKTFISRTSLVPMSLQ
jgi:hypothetical protein